MLMPLALAVVALTSLFLIGLGLLALAFPVRAQQFLLGLAGTEARHYLELLVRIVIGSAFVFAAPGMAGSGAVRAAGWVLVATTVVLLFVPWPVHRAFARRTVPKALLHLPLLALGSLVGGGTIAWSLYAGSAA